jgi:hypothetical protein
MTAAGLTVLGICREQLALANKLPVSRARDWDRLAESAIDWLGRHFDAQKNPVPWGSDAEEKRWYTYYLYGVERVGSLFARTQIGAHDWYWEGARALVVKQGKEGQWASPYGEAQPNTCFALLFLERATAALSGGGRAERGWGETEATAAVRLRGSGRGPITMWIDGIAPDVLTTYAWPAVNGGGVRVRRVEYLLDDAIVETIQADPDRPLGRERFPARIAELSPGAHTVSARLVVVTADLEEVTLDTGTFTIETVRPSSPWMRDYALDRGRNLLAEARVKVTVSSEDGDAKFDRNKALDNLLGTGWLSKKGDTTPWIELDLKRPLKAKRLVLSNTRPNEREADAGARIVRVEVIINDRKKTSHVVELSSDPLRKTALDFGKTEMIRQLRIEVLEFAPGAKRTDQVGFAEIELQNER